MKKVAVVLAVTLALLAFASIMGTRKQSRKPESWLEGNMLTEVSDFALRPKGFDEKISYKMDERSYEILDPVGIACQTFEDPQGRLLDVVIIAGDSMEAFHDQKVCFSAQGWELKKDKNGNDVEAGTLHTKAYGEVPVSWMRLSRPGSPERYAVYIFRDPQGFNTYDGAKWGFVKAKIKDPFHSQMGFSYRFIGLTGDMKKEDVERVASEYLDKLAEATGGQM